LRISPSVKEISPADLAKKIQGDPVHGPPDHLHIIDVRETYEWNSGAVPYAKYVGKGVLERDIVTFQFLLYFIGICCSGS
jgi:hypothetical protein